MNISLKIQSLIAFLILCGTVVYTFFNLVSKDINFMNLQQNERLYFVCLIINELIYGIIIIYSLLYSAWSLLTCCWREGPNNNSSFSSSKGCGILLMVLTNINLFYSLYLEPIELPQYLIINGQVFLGSIVAIISVGILFYCCRLCYNSFSRKKKLLKYNNMEDDIV